MTRERVGLLGTIVAVVAIAAAMSSLAVPGSAVSAPSPTDVPITVIIPDLSPTPTLTATPTPTPRPSQSNGGGATPKPTPSSTVPGGGGTNPDGSPIPPNRPTEGAERLKLDHKSIVADKWMIATATGFAPGEKGQFVLYPGSVVIGSYLADAAGKITARFRIAEETRPGVHVAEATGWTSGHVANEEFTVVTVGMTAGWPLLWWVLLVLGVLLTGLIATAVHFRRSIRSWSGPNLQPAGSVP